MLLERMAVKFSEVVNSYTVQHPYYEVIVIKTRGSVRKLVVMTSAAKTVMLFTLRRKERM